MKVDPQTSPAVTNSTPVPGPAPGAEQSLVLSPTPLPRATRVAVPTPSLKPGEVITWIKLDTPRFPIGQIIISSLMIVGVAFLFSLSVGLVLGYLRSKRTGTHGTRGLDLR